MAEYDVLIVGSGLVGSCLGLALADRLRVGIIDAKPAPQRSVSSTDQRSFALALGSQLICQALGLWSAVAEQATPIRQVHVSDRGHFGALRISARQMRVEALGYVVPAAAFISTLQQQLLSKQQLAVHYESALTGLAIETNGAVATVRSGGVERRIEAQLIVAADGTRSTVRQLLQLPLQQRDYQRSAIVSQVSLARDHQHCAYERYTTDGPLAMLPLSGQRAGVVWTTTTDQLEGLMQLSDTEFLARLQRRFGYRLGRLLRVGKRQAFPLQYGRITQPIQPRVVVVGNAAHTIPPLAAQGFNLGLRDVAVLAQLLNDAVAEKRSLGDFAILQAYQQWRERDQRSILRLTDGSLRLFSNDLLPLVLARNVGLLGADLIPWLKQRLARQTMGQAGRLTALSCGVPLTT